MIWNVWKSGPTCTKTGSLHCLGIWYAMLMPCVNYWTCDMVHMYMFHPLMKREVLLTIFVWIEIFPLFIMYHLLSYILDIWHYYLPQCTSIKEGLHYTLVASIHCDSMCFICLFILTHMCFLSMCFTVPYLLVNYVRIQIYIWVFQPEWVKWHTFYMFSTKGRNFLKKRHSQNIILRGIYKQQHVIQHTICNIRYFGQMMTS